MDIKTSLALSLFAYTMSISLALIMSTLELVDIWDYPDFNVYKELGTGLGPNFLYSSIIDWAQIERLSDSTPIILASLIFIFNMTVYVKVLGNYRSLADNLILITLISLNPFFSLTSLIFDTIIFFNMFVAVWLLHWRGWIGFKEFIVASLLLSSFRASIILIILPYLGVLWLQTKVNFRQLLFSIVPFILLLLINWVYLESYLTVSKKFDFGRGLPFAEDELLYIPIYTGAKILTLFGGREAIYTLGFDSVSRLQLAAFSVLAVVNIYGLVKFVTNHSFRNAAPIILPIMCFLGFHLLTVVHARYTVPLTPFIAAGLCSVWSRDKFMHK